MTTGVPIYLVSACASGEEFVSAFRRYADRNGVVFVPIAQPLPPGKKGRFALTLKDGGVMVEGEAEVVSSAKTPSVLYGRVGMTLKFTEPDDPSKTMLGELEKARLAAKPGAPSVPPRPAAVPPEPRPTVPTPTGRIDATNALAECVAIGDVAALGDGAPRPPAKFTVPSIPPAGTARPKTPSVPPSPTAATMGMPPIDKKPVTGNQPAIPRPAVPPPRPATPSQPMPVISAKETVMGMPPLEKAPATSATPSQPMPVISAKETVTGMPALEKAPAPPPAPAARKERDDPTVKTPPRGMPTPASVAAAASSGSREKNEVLQTVRGPAPGVDLVGKKTDLNETMRGPAPKLPPSPSGTVPPPLPKTATPATPSPVVARKPEPPPRAITVAPEAVDLVEDEDEPTDLTSIPIDPSDPIPVATAPEKSGREPRKTVMGVAVVPSGVHVLPAAPARQISEEEARDTSVMDVPHDEPSGPAMISSAPPKDDPPPRPKQVVDVDPIAATQPAAAKINTGMINAAVVEESTPSGDWTMTPGANGPTITPTPRAATPVPGTPAIEVADPEDGAPIKKIPAGPPTGDWSIALDPSQPDGWSEPSRIEKRPEGLPPEQPGPPKAVVASEKDLDSEPKVPEPKPAGDEAKVEIDPTLMEPLQPLQPIDDFDDEPQLPPPPSTSHPIAQPPADSAGGMAAAAMAPMAPTPGVMVTPLPMPNPMAVSYVTPVPGQIQLASSSGQVPAYPVPAGQGPPGRALTDGGAGFFRDTTDVPRYSEPNIETEAAARKRRIIVIAASAGGALLIVIVLAVVLSGGKKTEDATGSGSGAIVDHSASPTPPPPATPDAVESKTAVPATPDATTEESTQVATPVDAAQAVTPPQPPDAATEVVTQTDCTVDVSSAPQGAEILLEKDVIGTTPAKVKLPCGVESRLSFRKQRFVTAQRAVTPKAKGQKPVRVALARVTFTVKVSSSPAGATIFLGAKSLGITPAAVKLPAFELSTLKISKDGYAPDIQKITPKTNNLSISASLKKQPPKKGALR